jgi:C4-dicarboxylate-specific signal transduction histidine kinase
MSHSVCCEQHPAMATPSRSESAMQSHGPCDPDRLAWLIAALQQQQTVLTEIERMTSAGAFFWNATTGEVTCTQEIYHIFELDPAQPLCLQRLRGQIHPDDLALFEDMIERVGRQVCGFEYQLRIRPTHHAVKHLKLIGRRNQSTILNAQYVGVIQDVTQRHLAQETLGNLRCELARVARVSSLGTLSASITHEVNQPLAGIMTNASTCLQMLADEPPDVEGARATAQRTIRDCERACEVIARMRALFGKQSGKSEPLDLNAVTTEVLALSWSELQRRRVVLSTDLAERLPVVVGDAVQLQQVILNLLLNAAEAMSGIEDQPRQILIRTEAEAENRVRLSVRDAGIGFELPDAERLFEPFFTTKYGGMGIGLSVSRSIIESHRGRLWAQPNAGAGATFTFSLPARANAEHPAGNK